ncbi:hornerin [Bicyclus anynana]|uniref:Hornerin n=1 Tax=Bicyclus anynana TaxID=110368 RepID=A0A6J1NHR1_BICAN|nr:hornerin [Bicyclus anynana]
MKLLIVLSIIACGYADKLDRAYLPPVNAATAGGSPGALIAPGATSVARPGANLGQSSQVDLGQGVSSGRQPGTGSGPSRPSTFSGVSENVAKGPAFGINQSPNGINQGSSGINQFPSTLTPAGGKGNFALLGANAPFGTSQGQTFGSSVTPDANTFNVGSQQTYRPQSEAPSGQTFGQQAVSVAQTYKPERAQAAADRNAEILKYVNDNNGESYLYSYETSNGISAEESGVATNGVKAQGGFSYTGDDGQAYSLTYTADENGFQPQGEHLPTPHPIPEEILKSIEENYRAAAAGTQEGAYRPEEYENENSPQQYNIGQSSFNRPSSQNQGSYQASFSQGPIGQSNEFPGNQGVLGASTITGQSGQFGQIRPSKGSNIFDIATGGSKGPFNQYQAENNQGEVQKIPSPNQIGNVKPNQFGTGSVGQNNQYQISVGSSQGPFGQYSNQGAINQGSSQSSKGQSVGYNYNQPQSAFGSATQFGSKASVQNRPEGNQGPTTSSSGSGNVQNTFGIQSGKLPSSETPFGFSQGSQFGQSQNSLNRPENRPSGSGALGQSQQNQYNINKPSFVAPQGSQVTPGGQASSGPTGYQTNADRPSFGSNRPSGTSFQTNQGSKYQSNGNKPTGITNGQQYQQNGNRPVSANTGSGQVVSPLGGSSGIKKTESGSFFGQSNQPFGSNIGPDQSGTQFGQSSQQFNLAQGSKSPGLIQAPYQYDRPSQSFPPQQQTGVGSGQRPGINSFGSSQGSRPGVSSPGSQGISGQQSSSHSQGNQAGNGRPGFTGNQGGSGQRPDDLPGFQGTSGPGGSYSGSLGVTGQKPGTSSQAVNGQRPFGSFSGTQGYNGPSGITQGASGQRPTAGSPGQSNQGRPEQFGGPRQPPSFNPQEGYKY